MAISFNKREQTKKKEQKRVEKQQRKEERKATPGNSFDDMIAYVDQNGVICDTPPSAESRQVIDIEDIAISTPKKAEVEFTPFKGRVEHFNQDKGFGFIKDIDSTEKYFFHISNAPEGIAQNDMVEFELEKGQRGLNAVKIAKTQ